MDELKVESVPLNVIPVTEYDPFEAKFAASLYWLVFRATEDGEFENIPSQVTSPIQRDSEKRITVRPEVTEFLTNGEVYCKVCNGIFHSKVPVVGQWAIIQTLSRHGFYVVEEGDIAVTDSALQQRKPFRKSTHLALMDCLMSAFSARAVTVQQVVQSVSKFSSFNASKELPFDLEDALLLWMNKICAVLNDDQLKKQKQHAEQLLQNQDKAKRFRFRRDQLQPKVQTEFPVIEDLLKDISDGQNLLGIIMFYHPTVISLEDIRFDKNLSTADCVHNLDLFRSLCSQFICTSVLALKLEDILYGSQAMKPNVIALLAEVFHKCEVETLSTENGVKEKKTLMSEVDLHHIVANKENVMDNADSGKSNELEGHRKSFKGKNERLRSSSSDHTEQVKSGVWKSQSDGEVNSNSSLSFKSPFHLDFTVDDDLQLQPPLNGPGTKHDASEKIKEKENPFSGIFQRPVLAGDRKWSLPNMSGLGGSPRTTPRQEHPLLTRRNKQKQRTLDVEEWDLQQEEVEELNLNDLQRSQSLTGLDKAKVEPRQSFHAWREDTGASLSDTNLASSRSERISLNFRPNLATSAPQRGTEGINMPTKSFGSKANREEHTSQDSLSSNDSLNIKQPGDRPGDSILSGARDSCMSDVSTKELNQFEEIEAEILAGRSVETPRTFTKPKSKLLKAAASQEDEDELNTSVSSEDMNIFRLEVLQRLTEDKLRQIPDGAEMEDDDDPILLARSNAVSGSGNLPDQRSRLEVQDAPTDFPIDQLSPITETPEPVVSNPNSVSSANSTAPSSPCSPLDVAPFMPVFFTTSPANTLERKNQRLSMKGRDDTEGSSVGQQGFPNDPETSTTPRFKTRLGEKSHDFPSQSKSVEHLARGSYTVGQVSVESAQAAGLPVIGGGRSVTEAGYSVVVSADSVYEPGKPVFNEEFIGRTVSSKSSSAHQEPSEVFHSRELSKIQTYSRQDLSGIRPLALSSGGVESVGVTSEGMDGRRDSLESSPAHSPALALGKRDIAYDEAVLRSREIAAQDSPSDVVIFERSLSNSSARDKNSHRPSSSQTRENVRCDSGYVTTSNKAEAYVFDFNQDAIHHYENGRTAQDFRTYKKSKQAGLLQNQAPQGNQRAASLNENTADQGFHRSLQDGHFGTYNKHSHSTSQERTKISQLQTNDAKEVDSLDGRPRHRTCEETLAERVYAKDLRQSDCFSTFRKDAPPEKKIGGAESEPSGHLLEMRRSDGFSTFRKGETASATVTHSERPHDQINQYPTFAKSERKPGGDVHQGGLQYFHNANASEYVDLQQAPPVYNVTPRTLPSRGGETGIQTFPRRDEEEQAHTSGRSNITRSRTFRKTPDGQIIKDHDISANGSLGASANGGSKLAGQQTVVTGSRGSPEGAGGDNPHRISWTDETEAAARLMRQHTASVERSESPATSPKRRGSPRQAGRGSPGARISWLIAAKSGVGGQVMLNDKGEIEESQVDENEESQAVTSQLAYLRMQLDEKRRHIEAEKHRAQAEWEDQRRRLGQTAFWYVIGKAQGGQAVGERPGSEVLPSDQGPVMQPYLQDKPGRPVAGFPDQPSPPIAWSSPANSPLPSVPHPASDTQQFETREFRLSDYPPGNEPSTYLDPTRPSSQPAVEVSSRPTSVPPRPSSHDPTAPRHTTPARKCWDVDVGQKATPPPLVRPDTASVNLDTKQETASPEGDGTPEIEVENHTPSKKGLAMFIGDDDNAGDQGLTPEQEKKREKFLRLRQKKQEEDRTRKEAELEKKRRRDEKLREKEGLRKMEEERLRLEEQERLRAEQELRLQEAQAARVPDSYATYRRAGPWQHAHDVSEDASSHIAPRYSQPSGFAEFSGPQCYVKPSGKSNRKIIVNAISHVCLSGTVNQDQKERCLQAISESDGHHFMILFKDGLKFRGIYVHNLENDQLFKVFGIGPRVVTSKMIEFLYKYNSGGKEFTKIPSKTISLSVDGLAIQKSCWNTGKPVVASKTSSNLKRPPRPPQR